MLQTRAGICPKCKEETPPGAEHCPTCGYALEWSISDEEHRAPRATTMRGRGVSTSASGAPRRAGLFLRLFVMFLVACLATFLAVTIRAKWGNKTDSPELASEHATLVQDAEAFRDSLNNVKSSPDAPEATYVLGIAMPRGKDVLEITVRNEWKSLDYPTRLSYAAKFVERWKSVHAPHRSNLTILDESGTEIGGRTWNGTVWVQEKHDDAPTPKPTAAPSTMPTADSSDNSNGNPNRNAAPNPSAGATPPTAPDASAPAGNSPATSDESKGASPGPPDAENSATDGASTAPASNAASNTPGDAASTSNSANAPTGASQAPAASPTGSTPSVR